MSNEKHVLMVTMEPPASHEDEFNDWYDTEHFPQRCALPGFLSGSRWVCLDGWPRYFAYYDLESADALASAAYHAVSGPNSTPWSQRILARTIGRQRIAARAMPGTSALPLDPAPVARLLLARYPAASVARGEHLAAAVAANLRPHRHLIETRAYLEEQDGALAVWAAALFRAVVPGQELAGLAATVDGVGATVFNLYHPYRRA